MTVPVLLQWAVCTVAACRGVAGSAMVLVTDLLVPNKTQPARGFLVGVTTVGEWHFTRELELVGKPGAGGV